MAGVTPAETRVASVERVLLRAAQTARVHDAGRLSLRRAARAAIVLPAVFALAVAGFHNQQMATFAGFGAFSMLVFADFTGPPASRAAAYAALTVCGALLIAAGTLLSGATWLAAAGMAAVGFIVVFAGALGGYVAAGGIAAILAFVLGVIAPATAAALPARLAGWGAAGAASIIAAVALWPGRPRVELRRLAGAAMAALADLIETATRTDVDPARVADRRLRAADAAASLERDYAAMPYRPAGPTTRDQAFAYLVRELQWVLQSADEFADPPPVRRAQAPVGPDDAADPPGAPAPDPAGIGAAEPPSPHDAALAAVAAAALRHAAATLEHPDRPLDLRPLEQERRGHAAALASSLSAALRTGDASGDLERRVLRAARARILAFAALSAAANAALTAGARVVSTEVETPALVPLERTAARRLGAELTSRLGVASVACQAGIRTAVALAAAVAIARAGNFQHGFWVVLATLSVLKSYSAGTRHTAWHAAAGTAAGFALASAWLAAGGGTRAALWLALPVFTFLAAYTPTAVHFVIGQSMFTMLVVVLFNLIQPEGWQTGAVRLLDILTGAGAAVIVGGVLWPRGARGQLRASLRSLFETGAAYLAASARHALGRAGKEGVTAASETCRAANLRADDAFAEFLNDHGPKRLPISVWSDLLVAGGQIRVAGDALAAFQRRWAPLQALSGAAAQVDGEVADLEQAIVETGRAITPDGRSRPPDGPGGAPGSDVLALVLSPGHLTPAAASDAGVHDMLHMAWVAAWLMHLRHVLRGVAGALAQVAPHE